MKKTKIVATISDKRCDVDFLQNLYRAGMNVVRLNTAHQNIEQAKKVIDNVRTVSGDIAILVDTKGPEVRTTLIENPFHVEKGECLFLTGDMDLKMEGKLIHVSYPYFADDIKTGDRILIDDGDVELVVVEKYAHYLEVMATNEAVIKDRKSVNVPGANLKLQSLSDKDKLFINFAIDNNVDFIAHSFVRNKEDVIAVQQLLDARQSKIKIIAKIENQEGVDNIDEILDYAYGVMVARGDLGIEIEAEKIPRIQRYIVNKCIESKKPVIIATQMLHTMIEHPRPTRAEISDIANAIYMGTDAIMLSGETAYGAYPVEAVTVMRNVAEENECSVAPDASRSLVRINNEITAALARAAVKTATILPVKAIVVDTLSGRTARYLAAFRGDLPVFARCYNDQVMRELSLSFGIYPYFTEKPMSRDEFMNDLPAMLMKRGIRADDYVVVVGGSFGHGKGASFIEVCKIGEIH